VSTENYYIELMNKEIDGLITPQEKVDLQNYLSENPAAKKLYQELKHTVKVLTQLPQFEPSPNLKKRIINSLDFRQYKKIEKGANLFSWLSQRFQVSRPQLAYIFTFGLVIGFIIHLLFFTQPIDQKSLNLDDLTGTIGIIDSKEFINIRKIPLDFPDISGNIEIGKLANFIILTTTLFSQNQYKLVVEYNNLEASFIGMKPQKTPQFLVENIRNQLNISYYDNSDNTLVFRRSDGKKLTINLKIKMFDQTIWSEEILCD
jgi:hypothetical protein